jgi:hypothetical protein
MAGTSHEKDKGFKGLWREIQRMPIVKEKVVVGLQTEVRKTVNPPLTLRHETRSSGAFHEKFSTFK